MPHLVLDLGGEGELPAQGGSAHEPLALRQDPHELAVRVHLDEAQDGRPVGVGHRIGGFHGAAPGDVRLEGGEEPGIGRRVGGAVGGVEHGVERAGVGHRAASSPWSSPAPTERTTRSA